MDGNELLGSLEIQEQLCHPDVGRAGAAVALEERWDFKLLRLVALYLQRDVIYLKASPNGGNFERLTGCLLYTSPSPRDKRQSRMPSSA